MSRKPERESLTSVRQLQAELWLAKRLGSLGAEIHEGVTTAEERRERMRQLILRERLENRDAGRKRGRVETFADLFARLYGEPLITDAMRRQAEELRRRVG